ncbi:MAG: hypothetical protein ABIK89_10570 [Planctomycetota bacterium]
MKLGVRLIVAVVISFFFGGESTGTSWAICRTAPLAGSSSRLIVLS